YTRDGWCAYASTGDRCWNIRRSAGGGSPPTTCEAQNAGWTATRYDGTSSEITASRTASDTATIREYPRSAACASTRWAYAASRNDGINPECSVITRPGDGRSATPAAAATRNDFGLFPLVCRWMSHPSAENRASSDASSPAPRAEMTPGAFIRG